MTTVALLPSRGAVIVTTLPSMLTLSSVPAAQEKGLAVFFYCAFRTFSMLVALWHSMLSVSYAPAEWHALSASSTADTQRTIKK
jgi:hypothetical protein